MLKRLTAFFLLTALLALMAAPAFAQDCDDPLGCIELRSDDPVTIAYMLTTSGATAFLGEFSLGGIELAIALRDGEILDREIELIGEDSLCSAEGGQVAAQRLAANADLVGVIGSSCSSEAVSGLPIISEAGLLMVSPSNTSPRLTTDDPDANGAWLPGYFRTAHNDLFQGAIAAQFAIEELELGRLATVHDGSAYAESLQAVMANVFTEMGGEVAFQGAVNIGDTDMTAILTAIASTNPDIIYFPIFEPESSFLATQVATIPGLENVILMSADGSLAPSFIANTGDAALDMYFSGPYVVPTTDEYQEFLENWEEVVGGDVGPFSEHAFDATNILLNAIEEVAVELDNGNVLIGRQALRDALTSLSGYVGLTGTLECNEYGDCATGEAIAIFRVTEETLAGEWPMPALWTPADATMD
jgi:branched-chain amino acid transport system substrate-binding protein